MGKKEDKVGGAAWVRENEMTTFTLPVSVELRELIRVAAAKNGESSSAYARRILEEAAKRDAK